MGFAPCLTRETTPAGLASKWGCITKKDRHGSGFFQLRAASAIVIAVEVSATPYAYAALVLDGTCPRLHGGANLRRSEIWLGWCGIVVPLSSLPLNSTAIR